ncbi:MAG: Tetrahydromethanopterin:alpha-L-glutamate ligase [Candidatus Thorarchaeota archaeon]|nr:MAG: Tetrahydromethanopterin:alpha-L-glutamate ligase [Candidatus Thorarchaeota archaeon]
MGETTIGLFSSDPWSKRVISLENALSKLGVEVVQVIPWKVSRVGSTNNHLIHSEGFDLSTLDLMFVLDLGANDIGAFFNRIGLLSALTEMGVRIINSVSSTLLMRNKSESMRKLISAQLPVPKTLITESIEDAAEFIRANFPCVLKPITGFGGLGVQLIEREFDLDHIYDYLKFHSQMFGKGAYILQEFIRGPGYDIRALVLDTQVIATMQRVNADSIVTNIHAGGTPRSNDIDVTELALDAAQCVRGSFVGVDIIPDSDGNLWVLEVNATPGWTGIQRVTDFDISERIAKWLIHLST